MKSEDGMLILGQSDTFCGHNVVNFWVRFLQLTVFKFFYQQVAGYFLKFMNHDDITA